MNKLQRGPVFMKQRAQTDTQEVPSEHQETLFYCEGDWKWLPRRLLSLHRWRYPKAGPA